MFLSQVITSPLIAILHILAALLNIPEEKRGIVAIVLVALLLMLALRQVVAMCKKHKVRPLRLLVVIWACLCICKLLPYMDSRTKTVTPELVATLEVDNLGTPHPEIYTYFTVSRWPFTLDSTFSPTHSETTADELDWILENTPTPDEYTYIISYGYEINALHYNNWDGSDILPIPWYGVTMDSAFETGAQTSTIYIYRIDSLPADTHP